MHGVTIDLSHVPDASWPRNVLIIIVITIDLAGAPVGRVQQDGINLALLLHIRLEVSIHQAPSDTACQLLSLELAGVLPPHLAGKQGNV